MTASRTYSIPASGLRHESGATVWTLAAVGCGGYSLNIRTNGAKTGGDWFQFSTNALNAWNAIVNANPTPAETPVVRLEPAAKGTQTYMSAAEIAAIAEAPAGVIRRGRGHGKADIRTMFAMARRGFVTLDHPIRPRIATVTDLGYRTAKRFTAELAAA